MGKFKNFWKSLGPGFITGAADDDPAGIAIYSIAGAKFGLSMLWTVIAALPFLVVIQRMCGRIGLISGRGLAGNMKKHYPAWILFIVALSVLIANIVNIGADISAMAQSVDLLFPVPSVLLSVVLSGTIIVLLIFMSYRRIAHILKWISVVLFAYILSAFFVQQDWRAIFMSLIWPPLQFNKAYLAMIVAIIGTTISPYLFFWQASEAVEEERTKHPEMMMPDVKPKKSSRSKYIIKNEVGAMYKDVYYGMFFSELITFFIMILSAATLNQHGITDVQSIDQIARVLRPLAGQYANGLFLIGILASGTLAIPVLAGAAGYALAEMFGWNEGFEKSFGKAKQFYVIIIIATILGLAIPLLHFQPVTVLYYTGIIFSIISPLLVGIIIHMANNPKIMGPYTSRLSSNIIAYILLIVLSISIITMFFL
ncbi:MAG TPA: Nramp family divalent metal transporter [Candidatus Paceibacterota bacterium]|nr:Nramp family divalent metal transporter [Candidatus Paceibacterota bacterium]